MFFIMGSFGTEFRARNLSTGKLDGELLLIDFAKSAAGYGVATRTVRTKGELAEAIEWAKEQTTSTLLDIKVLPKTMTDGYGAWWNVGVAQVSDQAGIKQASVDREHHLKQARPY